MDVDTSPNSHIFMFSSYDLIGFQVFFLDLFVLFIMHSVIQVFSIEFLNLNIMLFCFQELVFCSLRTIRKTAFCFWLLDNCPHESLLKLIEI